MIEILVEIASVAIGVALGLLVGAAILYSWGRWEMP